MRHSSLFFPIALMLSTAAFGQTRLSDSLFVQQAKNQAINWYERAVARQEHIYEGNEYIPHDHRIKIHPFFAVDSLQTGTITFNGVFYHDVPMLYDIVRDEVVVQPLGGGYRIQLRPDKIRTFSMRQHQFTRLESDTTAGIPTGFYEVLYDGKTKVLAQRKKTILEDISSGSYKAEYVPKDRFFIQKAGAYQEVKSKRSVLALYSDQAKPLKKYMRTNKLKFNDETREEAITKATQRYDELTL